MERARAASCLFRLLNSSQTRRCHPAGSGARPLPGDRPGTADPLPGPAGTVLPALLPLPASRRLTAWHRHRPTLPSSFPSSHPAPPHPGLTAQLRDLQHSPGGSLQLPDLWSRSVWCLLYPSSSRTLVRGSLCSAQCSRVDKCISGGIRRYHNLSVPSLTVPASGRVKPVTVLESPALFRSLAHTY